MAAITPADEPASDHSSFMKLPIEIRSMIYSECFNITLESNNICPALLRVNRQVLEEVQLQLLRDYHFVIVTTFDLPGLLERLADGIDCATYLVGDVKVGAAGYSGLNIDIFPEYDDFDDDDELGDISSMLLVGDEQIHAFCVAMARERGEVSVLNGYDYDVSSCTIELTFGHKTQNNYLRRKTEHALLAIVANDFWFCFSNVLIDGATDKAHAAEVMARVHAPRWRTEKELSDELSALHAEALRLTNEKSYAGAAETFIRAENFITIIDQMPFEFITSAFARWLDDKCCEIYCDSVTTCTEGALRLFECSVRFRGVPGFIPGFSRRCKDVAYGLAATALEHIEQCLLRLEESDAQARAELHYQAFVARVVLADECQAREALRKARVCTEGVEKLEKAWEAAQGDKCAMMVHIMRTACFDNVATEET